MYLDIKGLVTCAVGILIDPVSAALELPWRRDSDGERATPDQVRAAWSLLKGHQEYAHRSTASARALTRLYLDDAAIDAVVARKLADNAAYITAHHYPLFESFPADAQLAIMSIAWACGPGFPAKWPNFTRAVLAGDWKSALANCTIREEANPGVVPRNRANRVCLANAEIVTRCGLQRDILRWPSAREPVTPRAGEEAELQAIHADATADANGYAADIAKLAELREQARIRTLDENRLEGHREMSAADDDEITVVEGQGRA